MPAQQGGNQNLSKLLRQATSATRPMQVNVVMFMCTTPYRIESTRQPVLMHSLFAGNGNLIGRTGMQQADRIATLIQQYYVFMKYA